MSNTTISPNMGLPIPVPGTDPGPDYASNLNSSLTKLDQHTHAAGSGVPITPSAMNINADLSFGSNNATALKTARFTAQSASLAGITPNLGCVYVAGQELYYNDTVGNVVPITNNGSVNSGAGSITGLPSGTASATYNSGSKTFIWQSATSTPANMDGASFIFRNLVASSKALTLNPPNSMAADYTLTLPSIPGSTSVLGIDTAGNISAVTTSVASAGADGIGTSMTSTGANAVANSRSRTTGSTVAAGGIAQSASSGAFTTASGTLVDVTNLTVTITTTGRPVMLMLQHDGSGSGPFVGGQSLVSSIYQGALYFLNGSTQVIENLYALNASGNPTLNVPPGTHSGIDFTVNGSPGTYTYKVQAVLFLGSATVCEYCTLVAYEL